MFAGALLLAKGDGERSWISLGDCDDMLINAPLLLRCSLCGNDQNGRLRFEFWSGSLRLWIEMVGFCDLFMLGCGVQELTSCLISLSFQYCALNTPKVIVLCSGSVFGLRLTMTIDPTVIVHECDDHCVFN